ncbi:WDR60 [Mytilus edulis]|uniref:WDR60 n=1 Tax=Mytilus edulis TaxID=6550 RepID=A0A8S3V036_MYTED|nr:WDR60 [Mytilus edulis]
MDLPPVKEYELFCQSDTTAAYVQTNDDAIDRDIQTEEIDMRNKWTQHPPEDFAGSGRGDGEKDFEDEEQSQQNKQQDLGRLSKFIQQAGQVVSILLDEERSQETTELRSNKSSISMSEGYTELSKLGILQGKLPERLPSKSLISSRLMVEAKIVACKQACEAMLTNYKPTEAKGNVLHQASTTKYHDHYEGMQVTLKRWLKSITGFK